MKVLTTTSIVRRAMPMMCDRICWSLVFLSCSCWVHMDAYGACRRVIFYSQFHVHHLSAARVCGSQALGCFNRPRPHVTTHFATAPCTRSPFQFHKRGAHEHSRCYAAMLHGLQFTPTLMCSRLPLPTAQLPPTTHTRSHAHPCGLVCPRPAAQPLPTAPYAHPSTPLQAHCSAFHAP